MPDEIRTSAKDEVWMDRASDSLRGRRSTPEELEKLKRRATPENGSEKSEEKSAPD